MDFQVVVLAGATSKKLIPLISKEVPKALLPVGNRPLISYVLELLEQNNLKDIIVVVGGQDNADKVGSWISNAYIDRLQVEAMSDLLDTQTTSQFLMGLNGTYIMMILPLPRVSRVCNLIIQEGKQREVGNSATLSSDATALQIFSDKVVAVPEDKGTAGALRAISHLLTASDILVLSGDLVCDVPPGSVAAAHRRHDAVVTSMLCSTPVSGPTESVSSSGKDKTKKPARSNIIGLDVTKQYLLHISAGIEVEKGIRVQRSILRAVGQMEMRTDLMDAHLYAFKRSVLQEVLDNDIDQKEKFQSLKQDVLPYLVRSQLRSLVLRDVVIQAEENGNENKNQVMLSQLLKNASIPSFHELYTLGPCGSGQVPKRTHKCCVYIASKDYYCARLNSVQAYSDINRDVTGEASHLSGYLLSPQTNCIHPSAEVGSKTAVGGYCLVGEGSQMGDKCSVKRSVIGGHCRIGSNVKIVNSVVMNHVTIGDGCSIQGSIICSNVQLHERVVLKDCQVGAGYVVTAGSEHKGESLPKKDKFFSI